MGNCSPVLWVFSSMEQGVSKTLWASGWIYSISSSSIAASSWKSIFDSLGPENRFSLSPWSCFSEASMLPEIRHPPLAGPQQHWALVRCLPTHPGLWCDRFTVRPRPTSQLPSVWWPDTKSTLLLSKAHFFCAAGPQRLPTTQLWSLSSLWFLWYLCSL